MSIPATTAITDSDAALLALVTADNTKFIADVDQQILDAIDLGKFEVSATTFGYVNPHDIYVYYLNLGYMVTFPDLIHGQAFQPADLFGQFWIDYWNHTILPRGAKNPVRMLIFWPSPNPAP